MKSSTKLRRLLEREHTNWRVSGSNTKPAGVIAKAAEALVKRGEQNGASGYPYALGFLEELLEVAFSSREGAEFAAKELLELAGVQE